MAASLSGTARPCLLSLLTKRQQSPYGKLRDRTRKRMLHLFPTLYDAHGQRTDDLDALDRAAIEIIAASLPRGHRLYRELRMWRQAL